MDRWTALVIGIVIGLAIGWYVTSHPDPPACTGDYAHDMRLAREGTVCR